MAFSIIKASTAAERAARRDARRTAREAFAAGLVQARATRRARATLAIDNLLASGVKAMTPAEYRKVKMEFLRLTRRASA